MRVTRLVVLALVLSGPLLGCGGDDDDAATPTVAPAEGTTAAPEDAAGDAVTIVDFAFDPEAIEVAPGTTVQWTNEDDSDHSVVSASDLAFESDDLGLDDTFAFAFDQPGEYEYFCGFHAFMTGTVTVQG